MEKILTRVLTPYPAKITQSDKQLMLYTGSHYYLTPYLVHTQVTTVALFSPNVVSFSKLKPTEHVDTTITYGPYEKIEPLSTVSMFF